ncbi:MAG: hypothetical protein U0R50_16560 [Gaiellales bacterium]
MSSPHVDQNAEDNAGVLAFLAARNERDHPLVAAPETFANPYLTLGSHPDVVARVWDELGAAFPPQARCAVYGGPALVDPRNGVVVALALGTSYALAVPLHEHEAALAAGLSAAHTYGGGSTIAVEARFGPRWLFGAWIAQELEWVAKNFE